MAAYCLFANMANWLFIKEMHDGNVKTKNGISMEGTAATTSPALPLWLTAA